MAGTGVPARGGIRGDSRRVVEVEVVGVEGEGNANSRLTSSFIPRRPRSPSSPSEELSWESSLCH